jgi:hypothetical protein
LNSLDDEHAADFRIRVFKMEFTIIIYMSLKIADSASFLIAEFSKYCELR